MSALYVLEIDEARVSAQHEGELISQRLELFELALDRIPDEGPALLVLSAGFVRVDSHLSAQRVVRTMASRGAQKEVSLVFGVEVIEGGAWAPLAGPPERRVYYAERGRASLLEGTAPARASPIGRISMVTGRHAFEKSTREVIARDRSALVLVLAHGAVSSRWAQALCELDRIAPTLAVGALIKGRGGSDVRPPRGWTLTGAWPAGWGRTQCFRDSTRPLIEDMMRET